jgi:hypothetical protein
MLDIINFMESSYKDNPELKHKLELVKKLITYLSEHDIERSVGEIIPILGNNTGYSEYRIINDCESDNPALWSEYQYNGEKVRLNTGDIVLTMKK